MKKKLLICGCAGFILSSFVRYMLYRSKDFEIIGVDTLNNIRDYNNLYVHKNNTFYVGNICDYNFVKKIIEIHNPDIIINGTNCSKYNLLEYSSLVRGAAILNSFKPIIQLLPAKETDNYGIWNCIKNIALSNENNLCIEFPNCFGRRQKNTEGFGFLYNKYKIENNINGSTKKLPWVFSEDVASFVWFAIEKNIKGYLRMPTLGYLSISDIEKSMSDYMPVPKNFYKYLWEGLCTNYEFDNIVEWKPDSENIEKRLNDVINWYDANGWAIK